jgi:hypothetical protein
MHNLAFPPEKRYLRRSGWRSTVQGLRHTWTLKKNTVLNIVSFPPLNYSPSVMAVVFVVVLGIVLLSCCCCCLCLLCCRIANTAAAAAAAATTGTPPPPPPVVREEDDACYTNTNSRQQPHHVGASCLPGIGIPRIIGPALPAGCAGGKGGNNDGGTGGGGQSRIAHQIGMVLPSPTQGGAMVTRVAGK